MPVLARIFEEAGFSTIMVTNMPYWAEKMGVPRTLAVEFPFGHLVGQPNNRAQQMRVIGQALDVLESASEPETIVHSEESWPTSFEEAQHVAHAETPPPIGEKMGRNVLSLMRGMRRGES